MLCTSPAATARGFEDGDESAAAAGGGGTGDGINPLPSSSSICIREAEEDRGSDQRPMDGRNGDKAERSPKMAGFLGMRRRRRRRREEKEAMPPPPGGIITGGDKEKRSRRLPLLCCSCVDISGQEAAPASSITRLDSFPLLDDSPPQCFRGGGKKKSNASPHLLLRSLIERNDFYSADCSVHLPREANNSSP